ncbi:MAG: TetR/AcrR family transcriptional regulator [Clostridia bacterium]|nr:TetR/AcrR family transcriptional regulator [Clostridia bacterium]
MKELTSRQQQAIATKKRIEDAATILLIEEGYENLTMNKIAIKAGVSVGLLYHYYASKEELFFTFYSCFDDLVAEKRDEILFSSPLEAIRAVVYASAVSSFLLNPTLMASLLSIQLSTHSQLFSNEERVYPQYILDQVKKALACGELIPIDTAEQIAQTILRSARSSIFDCAVHNTPESIEEITMHDLDIVLSHYRPDHSSYFPSVNPIWLELNRERILPNETE